MTLKNEPTPAAFNPSFACVAIHCASKFCCETYPVNAHGTATMNATAPVIHTRARPPRHAAIQYFPHRWTTMKKKNSSTDHRWMLLKKWPTLVKCHQPGPFSVRITPDPMINTSDTSDSTPNT